MTRHSQRCGRKAVSKRKRVTLLLTVFLSLFLNLSPAVRAATVVNDMNEELVGAKSFHASLESVLASRGLKVADLCDETDAVQRRVLREYGAVFIAGTSVAAPPVCVFTNATEVSAFQSRVKVARAEFGGATIELQAGAMRALLAARAEAQAEGLDITPRDGAEAARRVYEDTLRLWDSRFLPALEHWRVRGAITDADAERLASLGTTKQVAAVLELEERGLFFSRDFSKSILYSVAAPGTSQHLSLLAFDANEYGDARVRTILASHGWFRTVRGDCPHFTFLDRNEKELKAFGLTRVEDKTGEYWIPSVR